MCAQLSIKRGARRKEGGSGWWSRPPTPHRLGVMCVHVHVVKHERKKERKRETGLHETLARCLFSGSTRGDIDSRMSPRNPGKYAQGKRRECGQTQHPRKEPKRHLTKPIREATRHVHKRTGGGERSKAACPSCLLRLFGHWPVLSLHLLYIRIKEGGREAKEDPPWGLLS